MAFFGEDGSLRNVEDPMFEAKRNYILSQSKLSRSEGYEHIFIKDLAYYVRGSFDEFIRGEFANFTHTFLIRDPTAVAPSIQRVCKAQDGEVPFFTDTLGFEEMYNMYETVKNNSNSKPLIIAAEDIFDAPRSAREQALSWVQHTFPRHIVELTNSSEGEG